MSPVTIHPRRTPHTPGGPRAPRRRLALSAALVVAGLLAAGCAEGDQSRDAAGSADASTDERSDARPQAGTEDQREDQESAAAEERADAEEDADGDAAPPADEAGGAGAEAADWCATEALSATVTPLDSGAGNRYAALVLTNTTDASCRTQGWPGLELAADDGSALPTETVRDTSREAEQLTLAPGESAWAQLRWTVVPGSEDPADGACGPEPAELRVIPPDTYDATPAEWDWGTVCGAGRIEALPLAAGNGP